MGLSKPDGTPIPFTWQVWDRASLDNGYPREVANFDTRAEAWACARELMARSDAWAWNERGELVLGRPL